MDFDFNAIEAALAKPQTPPTVTIFAKDGMLSLLKFDEVEGQACIGKCDLRPEGGLFVREAETLLAAQQQVRQATITTLERGWSIAWQGQVNRG